MMVEVSEESFNATGLIPNTHYNVQVAGININGTGPFSSITVLTGGESMPLC